jgi:hypothetical protein
VSEINSNYLKVLFEISSRDDWPGVTAVLKLWKSYNASSSISTLWTCVLCRGNFKMHKNPVWNERSPLLATLWQKVKCKVRTCMPWIPGNYLIGQEGLQNARRHLAAIELCRALVSLVFLHMFWVVLHKTRQHGSTFFFPCKNKLRKGTFKLDVLHAISSDSKSERTWYRVLYRLLA